MIASQFASLRDFYARAYRPLRLRGRSPKTDKLYANLFNNFARYLSREPTLADLDDDTVGCFVSWFLERGRSPVTANRSLAKVKAIWRFACRKNLVAQWPDVMPLIEPHRDPQAWLKHELAALYASILKEQGEYDGIPRRIWWAAHYALIWDTGERISAVMGLQWLHVDLQTGWLRIPAELRKGKRADKTFRLHRDTVAVLRMMQRGIDRPIFPWPYSDQNYIYQHYNRILRRAGLPVDRSCKFHKLRRSVASWFEAAGGDATALLDHSGRKVTVVYLDPRIVGARQASELLFRPWEE